MCSSVKVFLWLSFGLYFFSWSLSWLRSVILTSFDCSLCAAVSMIVLCYYWTGI